MRNFGRVKTVIRKGGVEERWIEEIGWFSCAGKRGKGFLVGALGRGGKGKFWDGPRWSVVKERESSLIGSHRLLFHPCRGRRQRELRNRVAE